MKAASIGMALKTGERHDRYVDVDTTAPTRSKLGAWLHRVVGKLHN